MDNWEQGEWLIGQWLRYNKEANFKAQDICLANESSFKELFKYAFKSEVKCSDNTNAKRYDVVFNALRGKRTYQAFGGIKAIEEDFTDEDLKNGIVLEGMANRVFKWIKNDWYDRKTGYGLVGLAIPDKVKKMIAYPEIDNDKSLLTSKKMIVKPNLEDVEFSSYEIILKRLKEVFDIDEPPLLNKKEIFKPDYSQLEMVFKE
ncbi:hypothetical protein [Tenacibaculum piscium]|nr:hypothetical protein [Tenacibaculum piscium]